MASSKLRIGRVTLRRHQPTVVVPFTDETPWAALTRAARTGLDFAEARVDLFRDQGPGAVIARLERVRQVLPLLVTLRSASEGGAWRGSETARLELYRALMPFADAVDVELGAKIHADVVRVAHGARRLVVLSHHDFERTPSDTALERVLERGFAAGADIVKIAAQTRSDADCARLAALLARHEQRALVVIGMGEHGKKTRVLFPALGSLFTFASLGKATAPGQLDLAETRRALATYYPDYARPKR